MYIVCIGIKFSESEPSALVQFEGVVHFQFSPFFNINESLTIIQEGLVLLLLQSKPFCCAT